MPNSVTIEIETRVNTERLARALGIAKRGGIAVDYATALALVSRYLELRIGGGEWRTLHGLTRRWVERGE
jgi:hypothetical protein